MTDIIRSSIEFVRSRRGLGLIVSLVAIVAVICRVLLDSSYGKSALLYIAVPFFVTLGLVLADGREYTDWKSKYYRAFRGVFIIFGAVSIVLFEGFVCVLMFLPIYLFVSLLAMAAEAALRHAFRSNRKGKLRAYTLPLLAVIASLEGTHTQLAFDRYNEVSVTRTVTQSTAALMANIGTPFDLRTKRAWFLRAFPMPDPIGEKMLEPGAVHEVHYTYHRWLITNTHRGRMLLEMTDVRENGVTTTVLDDTSYISSYLRLLGTRIDLQPLDDATTEVTMTVRFERKLDPAWYFGPLQRYGVTKMAELLIEEVIVR
jgi:hypothetical protein